MSDSNRSGPACLGKFDSCLAVDRSIAVAKSPNRHIRATVAHGLARRNSPKATQALSELRSDEDYSVRYNAILAVALAQVPVDGRPEGLPLIRLLHESAVEEGAERLRKRKPRFSLRRRS